jgi:hypothetical protein
MLFRLVIQRKAQIKRFSSYLFELVKLAPARFLILSQSVPPECRGLSRTRSIKLKRASSIHSIKCLANFMVSLWSWNWRTSISVPVKLSTEPILLIGDEAGKSTGSLSWLQRSMFTGTPS